MICSRCGSSYQVGRVTDIGDLCQHCYRVYQGDRTTMSDTGYLDKRWQYALCQAVDLAALETWVDRAHEHFGLPRERVQAILDLARVTQMLLLAEKDRLIEKMKEANDHTATRRSLNR